jgi:hypothetical protein
MTDIERLGRQQPQIGLYRPPEDELMPAAERLELHELAVEDVLTVRHSESPDLAAVRQRVEDEPDLPRLDPEAVLDAVVDGYVPVVAGL